MERRKEMFSLFTYDKYYDTRVERHAQSVYEEPFKPATYGNYAWHNAVEYSCHDERRHCEGYERTFQVGIRVFLVVIYKHYCRYAQKVQKVYADRQSGHIGYEYKPSVGMRLVSLVFPFQY